MKTVQLNPKQIARLLNIELSTVLNALQQQKFIDLNGARKDQEEKLLKNILKTEFDCTKLKIMQSSHMVNMENFDLMAETIKQINEHWRDVMFKVCHNDQCIKKIGFSSFFLYYDKVLNDDVVDTITEKLAEYHKAIHGKRTKEFESYTRSLDIKKKEAVCV